MAAPDYSALFDSAGQAANIDPLLLRAIQQHEDAPGDPNAVNPKSGATGVMQFMPKTATQEGVDPTNPGSSIYGAAHYLNGLIQYYGNDERALQYALSTYGGDTSGKAGYADNVLKTYRALQAQQPGADDAGDKASAGSASSGGEGGIKITMKAAPAPGGAQQGGASFVPPPGTPATFGVSNQPGSRAQHTMQASEYTDRAPSDDFGAIAGTAKPTPAATPAPQAAPKDDFGAIAGSPQTAAPVAPAAPPAPEPVQGVPEAGVPPSPSPAASAAPATDVTIPGALRAPAQEIEGTPISQPPPPSWWARNVATPVAQMYNPLTRDAPPMNYLFGSPSAQAIGAGVFQGARNVARTFNNWEQAEDQKYPWLASLDRSLSGAGVPSVFGLPPLVGQVGATPQDLTAQGQRLKAQEQQYRRQYGSSIPAAGGELAGDVLATTPILELGAPLLRAAETAHGVVGRTAPLVNTALSAGGQNALTSPDTPTGQAFDVGATGGLTLHGLFGKAGDYLARGPIKPAVQDAEDLGFNLSTGDRFGGKAKEIEDVTRHTPGGGAWQKDAQYRAQINSIINRNMGIDSPVLDQATLAQGKANAGVLMDRIKNVTIDGNADQTFLTRLADLHQQAADRGVTGITSEIDKLWNIMGRPNNAGTLPGQSIADLVQKGSALDNMLENGTGAEKGFAQQIKDAVYDAAQRSTSNPQAVRDFTQGRYIYKVMKTVEPLVNKTGDLDDATYAGVARRITQQGFDAVPDGDMAKLGRVLSGPLKELKSSGTARQLLNMKALGLLGGGVAGESALGAAAAHFAPAGIDQILAGSVPFATAAALGRSLRFGPGMGSTTLDAARQVFNPLLPRVAGPTVGANPLLSNQGQPP
jgi:Transglycosylase SLT domain